MNQEQSKKDGYIKVIGIVVFCSTLGFILLSVGINMLGAIGTRVNDVVVHMQKNSSRYKQKHRATMLGRVLRVKDGDSFIIATHDGPLEVRLLDDNGSFINASEYYEPIGAAATEDLQSWLPGQVVRLYSGVHYEARGHAQFKVDKYDRTCASIVVHTNDAKGTRIPLGRYLRSRGYVKE